MKLEQQFKQWLDTNPRKEIRDVELVNIANNYAIKHLISLSIFIEKEAKKDWENVHQDNDFSIKEITKKYIEQNNFKQ